MTEILLQLPGDLIEVIATCTPAFSTLKLVTLDEGLAGRLGYPGGLWKKKVTVEQKGLVFDDSVIGPTGWYIYYRIMNQRLEGGKLFVMSGQFTSTMVAGDVIGCLATPLGDYIAILCPGRYHTIRYKFGQSISLETHESKLAEQLCGFDRTGRRILRYCGPGFEGWSDFPEECVQYDGCYSLARSGEIFGTTAQRPATGIKRKVHILSGPVIDGVFVSRSGTAETRRGIGCRFPRLPLRLVPKWDVFPAAPQLYVDCTGTVGVIDQEDWMFQEVQASQGIWNPGLITPKVDDRYRFPEVPIVIRAIWGSEPGDILLLSPDGKVHLYNGTYRGTLDIPLCCDLQQIRGHPVYVTVD